MRDAFRMPRAPRWLLLVGTAVVSCAVARAPARAAANRTPSAICRTEHLPVVGARLYLRVRGADRRAPVLLWLHGGPGAAETPLFRLFDGGLEEHFVVAYWDQRGAGRSFDPDADPHTLSIPRHLADLDAVVDHLRATLGRKQVVLVGHSWGSALGLLYAHAHPGKVAAFIGVGQVTSERARQRAQLAFVLAGARRRKDEAAEAELAELGPPPYSASEELTVQKLVDRYGGVFHRRPSFLWTMIRGVLQGVVAPWEIPRFIHANDVSLEAMDQEMLGLDLTRSVTRVDVPVFFFLGRYDRQADSRLAAAYFEELQAPTKELVWFEQSAHNIPFEEPRSFRAAVVRALREVGVLRAANGGPQTLRQLAGPAGRSAAG